MIFLMTVLTFHSVPSQLRVAPALLLLRVVPKYSSKRPYPDPQ